jgi:hypothetical protein
VKFGGSITHRYGGINGDWWFQYRVPTITYVENRRSPWMQLLWLKMLTKWREEEMLKRLLPCRQIV